MGYKSGKAYIDEALTDLVVEYKNRAFIGQYLCPAVKVNKMTGIFYTKTRADITTPVDGEIGEHGEVGEGEGSVGQKTYKCKIYGHGESVAATEQDQADAALDPEADAALRINERILLAQELRIRTMFETDANYAAGMVSTLAGAAQWSDFSGTSNPINDVLVARGKIWRNPGSKLIGYTNYDVLVKLVQHPMIVDRLKHDGSAKELLSEAQLNALAKMFKLDALYVAECVSNTANPGQTVSESYIWGKHFGITAVEGRPTKHMLQFAANFTYRPKKVTKKFYDDRGLDGVTKVMVREASFPTLVANDSAIRIKNAVA